MGKRGRWSHKEGEGRTLTPLPHSCGAPAGPRKALAGVPGRCGCPHHTHMEGPDGTSMREDTHPPWDRGPQGGSRMCVCLGFI